jgi:hypothetical protein
MVPAILQRKRRSLSNGPQSDWLRARFKTARNGLYIQPANGGGGEMYAHRAGRRCRRGRRICIPPGQVGPHQTSPNYSIWTCDQRGRRPLRWKGQLPSRSPNSSLRTQPRRSQDNFVAIQEENSRSQTSTGCCLIERARERRGASRASIVRIRIAVEYTWFFV